MDTSIQVITHTAALIALSIDLSMKRQTLDPPAQTTGYSLLLRSPDLCSYLTNTQYTFIIWRRLASYLGKISASLNLNIVLYSETNIAADVVFF